MDNERVNLLLDPSLLLRPHVLERTLRAAERVSSFEIQVFTPRSLDGVPEEFIGGLLRFFAPDGSLSSEDYHNFERAIYNRRRWVTPFVPGPDLHEKHWRFKVDLIENFNSKGVLNESLVNILYEEWLFLQELSWVAARFRKAFDAMIEAGAGSLELGRRSLDKLAALTLKKPAETALTNANRFRAFGKWLAAGGVPMLALVEPVTGAVAGSVAGMFLLIDPPLRHITPASTGRPAAPSAR